MEISRFEKAAAKRTAQNTKAFRIKRDKLKAKAEALINEIELLQKQIDAFDAPFVAKYGKSVEELLVEWENGEEPAAEANEEEEHTPSEPAGHNDDDFPFSV